jgi:ParB family chromosome partitioning protein
MLRFRDCRAEFSANLDSNVDVHKSYVTGISHLLKDGEERLISAVETGRIPLSVAMQIANTD